MEAQCTGKGIASSNNIVKVDGNAYFPLKDLDQAFIQAPATQLNVAGRELPTITTLLLMVK